MTFVPDRIDDFLNLFRETSPRIRSFEGCRHLELWRDDRYPNVMTTYSIWDGPEQLDSYRQSELFRETWERTRRMFAAPPKAFSHRRIIEVRSGPHIA